MPEPKRTGSKYDGHLPPVMAMPADSGTVMAMQGQGIEVANLECACGLYETTVMIHAPAPPAAAYFVALNRAQVEDLIAGLQLALDGLPALKGGV